MGDTITLYRPVGPSELNLIRSSGFRRFPPRLPGQTIFYPVVQENYARKIARDWNVKESGAGYVTRFAVEVAHLNQYPEQRVGGTQHTEYWIPADELDEFNDHVIGRIEVLEEYLSAAWVVAYNLATDHDTISQIQQATLRSKNFGVHSEVALFGSHEWWEAIKDGRIPSYEVSGTISRLFMTGHGDWPEFELNNNESKTSWTRVGNGLAYAEGNAARVEYVVQKSRYDRGEYKRILRVLLSQQV
jgi:hypothetical protein